MATKQPSQASQASQALPVNCKKTGKFIARKTPKGLHLWCKQCKQWEYWTWAELMATEEKPQAAQ